MGLTPEDFEDDEDTCFVWPDNWNALMVFAAMRNQWRSCGFGRAGLDMGSFPIFADNLDVPVEERKDIFQALLTMESAALSFFASKMATPA